MARKRQPKDTRGPMQRMLDSERVANDQATLAVITPEQRAKGTYEGERRIVNNHDPVQRWKAAGRLSDSQVLAIELCQHLWLAAGLPIRVTGLYGERIAMMGCGEAHSNARIDARDRLYRIMDYFTGLEKWWAVFENVCRWGEPAGFAGSSLGYGDRSAAERAHTVVCFVADKIAEQERL